MAISPPSSAKTHSLVYVLCFFFSISSSMFLLLCSLFRRPRLLVVVGSVLHFLISFIKSYDFSQTVCVDLIFSLISFSSSSFSFSDTNQGTGDLFFFYGFVGRSPLDSLTIWHWLAIYVVQRFGMALLGCIHKHLTALQGGNPSHGKLVSSCTKRWVDLCG